MIEAVRAGSRGYPLKTPRFEEIVVAIRAAAARVFARPASPAPGPSFARLRGGVPATPSHAASALPRGEREVLELVALLQP